MHVLTAADLSRLPEAIKNMVFAYATARLRFKSQLTRGVFLPGWMIIMGYMASSVAGDLAQESIQAVSLATLIMHWGGFGLIAVSVIAMPFLCKGLRAQHQATMATATALLDAGYDASKLSSADVWNAIIAEVAEPNKGAEA